MDERPKATLGRGRARRSRVLVCYLTAGAALAVLRVAALVWLEYMSFGQHRIDNYLARALYPENVLAQTTSLTLAAVRRPRVPFGLGLPPS
jgi:hypothetical protein